MKKIIILIFCLIAARPAFAAWYIVNDKNEIISKTDYVPNSQELAGKNCIAVESDVVIELGEAEYRAGKIVIKVKSNKEIEALAVKEKISEEMNLISKKSVKMACEALMAEGMVFKQIKCSDI